VTDDTPQPETPVPLKMIRVNNVPDSMLAPMSVDGAVQYLEWLERETELVMYWLRRTSPQTYEKLVKPPPAAPDRPAHSRTRSKGPS
jgi:hypothetical protein